MNTLLTDFPGLVTKVVHVRVVGLSPLVLREERDGDWVYGIGLKKAIVDAVAGGEQNTPLSVLRGAVHVAEQHIPLQFGERRIREDDKGSHVLKRPEYTDWSFNCTLHYNSAILPPAQLLQAIRAAGEKIGLGQRRLEWGGESGRFRVEA